MVSLWSLHLPRRSPRSQSVSSHAYGVKPTHKHLSRGCRKIMSEHLRHAFDATIVGIVGKKRIYIERRSSPGIDHTYIIAITSSSSSSSSSHHYHHNRIEKCFVNKHLDFAAKVSLVTCHFSLVTALHAPHRGPRSLASR
jgi:hypothetical protein